ncbi:MAG: hypothetical protein HOC27_01450 [Phycisphaerae bacterium]|jgi:hypothetical protein|nr:hypothetical protein [Phycisphaerae bacterium]
MNTKAINYLLLLLCATSFAVGIMLPSMTVTPKLGTGAISTWIEFFKADDFSPKTFSIVTGIGTLLKSGHPFLGVMILVFSVLFPMWKMQLLWVSLQKSNFPMQNKILSVVSKFSMVDVFVFAVIILVAQGYPQTEIEIHFGVFAFAFSALLSTLLTSTTKKHDQSSRID